MSGHRLFLARHGQTAANVARALDTRPPGAPLDELGVSQAEALAERLRGEPLTAVYASTATRAQQTAAPTAAVHGLELQIVEGVHEIFVGDLEGRADTAAREEFERVYAAWSRGELEVRLPGGESAADLHARFSAAVAGLTDSANGDVLLVSHGAAIRLGAAALLGDAAETEYLGNTGVVILRSAAPGWTLEHWDPAPPRPGDVTAGGQAAD
jgi:broad specificity phosphatase PhoE